MKQKCKNSPTQKPLAMQIHIFSQVAIASQRGSSFKASVHFRHITKPIKIHLPFLYFTIKRKGRRMCVCACRRENALLHRSNVCTTTTTPSKHCVSGCVCAREGDKRTTSRGLDFSENPFLHGHFSVWTQRNYNGPSLGRYLMYVCKQTLATNP